MADPRFVGTLSSFAAASYDKRIKRNSVTLQGNSGSGWVTLPANQYRVGNTSGEIVQLDNDGTDLVDWGDYYAYQDAGNVAFRVTYTIRNRTTGADTVVTNENLTITEESDYAEYISPDGTVDIESASNAWLGSDALEEAGGWSVADGRLYADNGAMSLESTIPALLLGSATAFMSGVGVFEGKDGGVYKWRVGDPAGNYAAWDNSTFTVVGIINALGGTLGGFNIGADYLRDTADSFGLASTVTSGDDVRFWAGAPFANRTIAPLQIYESGMIFAKDIILAKGSLTNASGETGYGYAVGEPNFLCHFDGPRPYATDYRGSAIGHKGQVDTRSGGVIFRKGMFGKAVQIAEATTNKVLNPSAETTGNFAARGTATVTRDTGTYYVGVTSYKVVLAAANDGIDLTLSALANANHYASFWVTGSAIATLQVSADGTNWNAITQEYSETIDGITWTHCIAAIPAAQANGSTTLRIRNTASSGTFYIDAVQVEQKSYPTPYCDGSLGNGHNWSGTAHASQSSRTAATLTYPFTGNMNFVQGSLTFWARENAVMTGFGSVFTARGDANNFIVVNLSGGGGSGNLIPYAQAVSGGSSTSTVSGTAAISAGWHHFVVTWKSGELKLYVDGAQTGTTANYAAPLVAPTNIEIGTFNGVNPANTLIDDLAILPYVLSPNEVKSIYYSTAPLMVGISNQEWRLSGAGIGDVWGNAYGIFARDANGNPSFGLFNAAVNTNTFGGANETLASGSLMLGNNNTGKANLTYDAAAGQLKFRGGTTTQAYIDTNGAIMAGGGAIKIDASAIASNNAPIKVVNATGGAPTTGFVMTSVDVHAADSILAYYYDGLFGQVVLKSADDASNYSYQFGANGAFGAKHIVFVGDWIGQKKDLSLGPSGTRFDDVDATNTSLLRITGPTGNYAISGFTGGNDGKILEVWNLAAVNMTINNQDTNSTTTNRIITWTGGNVLCPNYARLRYDSTTSRWRLMGSG
jgi:hypothetical protein